MGLIAIILIGILAGWLREDHARPRPGLLDDLLLGVVGSILGRLVFGLLGLYSTACSARS
jgi:uncharacterized membrane protein YeaQ/YmgE (transglycosylase-associated protein family)